MSLNDCINKAVRAGLMDQSRGNEAKQVFKEQYDQARLDLGDAESLARAREETVQIMRFIKAEDRRVKMLEISRTSELLERARASGAPIDQALLARLSADTRVKDASNIETRRKTLRGMFQARMDNFMAKLRRDLVGRNKDPATLANVMREIFGEDTGDIAAREMALAWKDSAELARKMFNQAGGAIPKLDDWGLPHSHDFISVRNAGFDDWYKYIRTKIDIKRMKDYRTGLAHTEFSLRAASREAFDNISTEGWAGRSAGSAHGQKLSSRRTDHRFFVFNNADDWSAYNAKFGSGDVFSIMMGHLDGMARDISALQILGPNPTATIRWMGDIIEKDFRGEAARLGLKNDSLESKAAGARELLETMYDHYTGAINAPVNGKVARTFAGVRAVLQSAQLGSAAISAIADLGFGRMAAGHIGLSYRKVLARQMSLLNPLNIGDQRLAVRQGLIADGWSSIAMAQQRYLGEVNGPEITQRLADFTMRVSGLSPWTQAGRWAFGKEFTGLLADNVELKFNQLPDPLRKTFERAGISSFDWDLARRANLIDEEGSKFLDPVNFKDEETAFKFLDMIHTETEFAVPSTSLRGLAALRGKARPGTLQGELIRSFGMYKSFSVTLMMTHHRRLMSMPTRYEKGRYAAQLALSTAIMGGFALQLKEISKGRDPRKVFDLSDPASMAKFWGAAVIQGGGLGIYGDLLFAQKNRFGGGFAQTIAGPVAGLIADTSGFVNQNATKFLEGEDTKVASGLLDLAQRYAPGGSLWYLRAGLQNLFFDELQKMIDPDASKRIRRIERRYKRDFGQEHFFSRANNSIRAPDLTAAFGE